MGFQLGINSIHRRGPKIALEQYTATLLFKLFNFTYID